MGGFTLNGCGAKDYFKEMRYLGDFECPNCHRISRFSLMRVRFKVSLLYIPTVTLKERYAIQCNQCEQGYYIEEDAMHRLMASTDVRRTMEELDLLEPSGNSSDSQPGQEPQRCSNCGTPVEGKFCGVCGAPVSGGQKAPELPVSDKKRCAKCGNETEGAFCGICGTRADALQEETVFETICTCGRTVTFGPAALQAGSIVCSGCGERLDLSEEDDEDPIPAPQPKDENRCPKCGEAVEGSFCGVCGTKIPAASPAKLTDLLSDKELGALADSMGQKMRQKREEAAQPVPPVTPPVTPPASTPPSFMKTPVPQNGAWECPLCGTMNTAAETECSLCGLKR